MRILLAVVLGVIAANVVFLLVGFVAEWAYPTPPELLDPQTPEETAVRVEGARAGGLALVVLGSALAGFAGGAVGARVATRNAVVAVGAIGALLALWGVYSFYLFYPARLWFPIGLFVGFPLFAVLGGLAVARLRDARAGGG